MQHGDELDDQKRDQDPEIPLQPGRQHGAGHDPE
jgi:hypothetical protein